MPALWTIEEVAQYLVMSAEAVNELAARRRIPYLTIGEHLRFRRSDIDCWLDRLSTPCLEEGAARSVSLADASADRSLPNRSCPPEVQLTAASLQPVQQVPQLMSTAQPQAVHPPQVTQQPRSGKGGADHRYLQELVKRWAEEHGFRATVEEQIPGGRESVDVALYRGETRVACEISVTTPLEYEVGNVGKCLAAGFGTVAVVSLKKARLEKLGKLLSATLLPEERERVHLFTPEELLSWLEGQPIHEEAGVVRGYKVKVRYRNPGDDRQRRVAAILARSMSGLQKGEY